MGDSAIFELNNNQQIALRLMQMYNEIRQVLYDWPLCPKEPIQIDTASKTQHLTPSTIKLRKHEN